MKISISGYVSSEKLLTAKYEFVLIHESMKNYNHNDNVLTMIKYANKRIIDIFGGIIGKENAEKIFSDIHPLAELKCGKTYCEEVYSTLCNLSKITEEVYVSLGD